MATRYAVRYEAPEAEGIPFPSLFDATCEPPFGLDAYVSDGDERLAEANHDGGWTFTVPGRDRICREVYGVARVA